LEIVETWASPHYGIKDPVHAIRLHLDADLPVDCRFRIEVD